MAENDMIPEGDEDDAEDFGTSLAIAHHLAILDLIAVVEGLEGVPKDKLDEIRHALTTLLPPEDIEVVE
jgi:hypothetical protein